MDDSSKNKSANPNVHLHDTLKSINDALDQWDKITNKPVEEQADSRESTRGANTGTLKSDNQELFLKLKDQLADLCDETDDETATESVTESVDETPTENHDQL